MIALITLCLTLLTIVAGLYLLAKTRKDGLGLFYKIVAYIVVIVGILSFVCASFQSVCKMRCGYGYAKCSENIRCGKMMGKKCASMSACSAHMKAACVKDEAHGQKMHDNMDENIETTDSVKTE